MSTRPRRYFIPLRGLKAHVYATSREEAEETLERITLIAGDYAKRKQASGDKWATLEALRMCAAHRIPMPEWLACLVEDAVGNALKGKPDEVLGFGNERMMSVWRKWGKRWRDDYVRKIARAWTPGRNGCSTRTALKAMLAREFKTSVKNIEKIILGSRAPTFQTKK